MEPFRPLIYGSEHVNNSVFISHLIDQINEYQKYINEKLTPAVYQGNPQEAYISSLRLRLLSLQNFLAKVSIDFCMCVADPVYSQPPINLQVLEVHKLLAEVRISVAQLLSHWESKHGKSAFKSTAV